MMQKLHRFFVFYTVAGTLLASALVGLCTERTSTSMDENYKWYQNGIKHTGRLRAGRAASRVYVSVSVLVLAFPVPASGVGGSA